MIIINNADLTDNFKQVITHIKSQIQTNVLKSPQNSW